MARKTGYTNPHRGRRGEHNRIQYRPIYREMVRKKVWHINGAKPRNYPSKHWSVDSSTSSGYKAMNIVSVTLSDLESSDEEFEEF